jgi:mannose-1-phosphate guanylyltransferase
MNLKQTARQPWTIVLAAGAGTRLRSMTRALHGRETPKQFAQIHGDESLLETTLRRVRRWSPAERTVIVVAKEHEALARFQVAPFSAVDVVAQPQNLGTGPGVLLPLARVLVRDPNATVVVVPSDHYVRDLQPFVDSVTKARMAAEASSSVVLIGAVPDRAEPEYGWIVARAEPELDGARVVRFEEKPPAGMARELLDAGALWNTFVMVGPARVLWQLAIEQLPEHRSLFEAYSLAIDTPAERETLTRLYRRMRHADFSRDVLHRAKGLRTVTLEPCGWSDWGTPERVLESLRGSAGYHTLVERLNAHARVHVHAGQGPLKPRQFGNSAKGRSGTRTA